MWALVLTLAVAVAGSGTNDATPTDRPTQARRQPPSADERQAKVIDNLVRRGDQAAVEYVVAAVNRGLPPLSLEAFLDAARDKPNLAYAAALRRLSQYRKDTIRARALVALASLGDEHGPEAALRALDDPQLEIRLLGLDLARVHTAPNVEDAVIRLLDRDAELAKAVRRARETEAAK